MKPAKVHKMIERYLKSVGLTKKDTFLEDSEVWRWTRGSAEIRVFMKDGGNSRTYLCIHSPLMDIPSENQPEFYRHLLDMNFNHLGIKLSTEETANKVYAIYERDIEGLDIDELVTCIRDLEWWADKLDDELQEQYPH